MKGVVLSAAAVLAVAAGAGAQPPAAVSVLPVPGPTMTGTVGGGAVAGGPAVGGGCLTAKCARVPCTPEVKPLSKTVYTTTAREFCVPACSVLGRLLSKCGLADKRGECGGETHTKRLLVKKLVPKPADACGSCSAPAPPPVVLPAPAPPVKH